MSKENYILLALTCFLIAMFKPPVSEGWGVAQQFVFSLIGGFFLGEAYWKGRK